MKSFASTRPRRFASWRAWLLALCVASAAGAARADTAQDTLIGLYARYSAEGRSDAEIHISASGPDGPTTRTTPQPDGSVACRIAGLQLPGVDPGAGRIGRRIWAALLVHEVTHCFTGPFLGPLLSGSEDADARRADLLIALTGESISDAAAVFAIARRDGADAGAALVAAMRPARHWAPSRAHETVPALNAALNLVRTAPQTFATPQSAFDAALDVGAAAARRAVPDAPAAAIAALQTALAQARRAYASGRYPNDAFTWRARDDRSSPGDLHVWLDGEELRRLPALGAEGAHAVERLRALIAADASAESALSLRWLRQVGDLQPASLQHTRAIVRRFVASLAQQDAARRLQVLRVLEETIDCCGDADIATVLDVAVDRLGDAATAR